MGSRGYFQVQTTNFVSDAQAYFDIANVAASGLNNSGSFTLVAANIARLTNNKARISLTFSTGASSTDLLQYRKRHRGIRNKLCWIN
jgi:hypothetical protein